RIGKRERHIDVGEAIVVIAAVEKIVGLITGASRDRYRLRTEEAFASRVGAIAVIDGSAGDGDGLRRIAAVQRQIYDAALIDDLGDGVLLRLNRVSVGLHLDLLHQLPDSHRDID